MSWAETDIEFMRAALAEAEKASASDEIPVGAVVVLSGEIIGSGFNRTISDCDPSGHAEILALRQAAINQNNHRLVGTTLYVTLEPCVMCVGAMIQARVQRLVFGAYDLKAGAVGSVLDLNEFKELNHRIEINGGLRQAECSSILKEFFEAKR